MNEPLNQWGDALRRYLLLPLLSLAVFLALGEVLLRWYLAAHPAYDVEMARYADLLKVDAADPRIGHLHRPNAVARLMGVELRINAAGFRGREYPLARDGARRLVFLGDSLTLGWGVPEEATFARLLEERLSRTAPTEVLNFGTGNYNTEQEAGLFLERGLPYRPDGVVLFWFINDAEPTPGRSRLWFLGRSRVLTFYWSRIRTLIARFDPARSFQNYYRDLYRDDQPGWLRAREAFRRLAAACRREGIGFRVVLLPELHRPADYPFAREHALVTDFLRKEGIPCLDLAPAFARERDPRSLWVASDDAHPNAKAHRIIAEASYDFIAGGAGGVTP